MSDRDPLSLHLDTVIEHALIARGMAGPIDDIPVPAEAIDAALVAADDYMDARVEVGLLMADLRDMVTDEQVWQLVLAMETASNAVVRAAADVGYRVGTLARLPEWLSEERVRGRIRTRAEVWVLASTARALGGRRRGG